MVRLKFWFKYFSDHISVLFHCLETILMKLEKRNLSLKFSLIPDPQIFNVNKLKKKSLMTLNSHL